MDTNTCYAPSSRSGAAVVEPKAATPIPKEDGDLPDPVANSEELWSRGLNWPIVFWIGLVHVFALIAPFYFSWHALIACGILIITTGLFGVCMGYHRLLTHGSFKTFRVVRWALAFIGGLSGEGSALMWVAHHRKHHAYSDIHGDPHSPKDGPWWSHMLWLMPDFGQRWNRQLLEKYAPDLLKDKMMIVIHYLFLPSHIAVGLVLFLIGYFGEGIGLGGVRSGLSMLFWGLGIRMVYVLHMTWCVNSATHMWGYRRYETSDNSRNLWWVGLLAFGEGWHNNHHAYQRVAAQGHKWYEIDTTWYAIWLMEKLGLVWDVVRVKDIPRGTPPA